MVLSVKREILSQLKRIGLHFEKSRLKVLPTDCKPLLSQTKPSDHQSGNVFYIDLPNETDSMFVSINRINHNLIKTLQNYSSLIENVEIRLNDGEGNRTNAKNRLMIEINYEFVVKELFKDLRKNLSDLFRKNEKTFDDTTKGEMQNVNRMEKIIVEYSSPNIAKPFHVGNLRSTIIGNSVANILQFKNHQVLRMNYLGDWGTQFGILSLSFDRFGDEEKLQSQPLKHLFEVYVKGNEECAASETWRRAAKIRFQELEHRLDQKVLEQWNRFRELSLNELQNLYERIGVKFDCYSSESMYSECSQKIVDMLREKSLIEIKDGAIYANVEHYDDPSRKFQVPLLKSDGTSLYLTRDIAAVLHRRKQFHFDRMYYVVDSSQAKHFTNLKSIFHSIGDPVYKDLKHLKFGRILGMSTRKGSAIFLEDVLEEAKSRALESIKSSPNTKISPDCYEQIADVLGVSSILIHDLANHRVKEYRFNWNRALKMNGDTGISLQYTHARLCNLIKNCGHQLDPDCDEITVSAIDTREGRGLIQTLLLFDEVVNSAYDQLEPSIITKYTFELKSAINRANQELTIKGHTNHGLVQTRLLLFLCAKNVLNQCMQLLGLKPLESM